MMLANPYILLVIFVFGFGAGVVVTTPIARMDGLSDGRVEGRNMLLGEQARLAREIEEERKNDDTETQNMSDYDVCRRDLGSRGLPIDTCNGLRGDSPR